MNFKEVKWLEPWSYTEPGAEIELERELSPGHPLFAVRAIAVGRRYDGDDVLFHLPAHPRPLAVVHLTRTGKREPAPEWPWTEFYSSWEEWIEQRMKPDHLEHSATGDS